MNRLAELAYQHGNALRYQIQEMETAMAILVKAPGGKELELIQARLQELRFALNGMELGAFSLRVEKAMGEAWRTLP